ncbi:hypothetical protein BDP27DRAFT_1363084 [Rhodocollybia butyracea]|uniref:Uncharacterized protein n=1 Tax=Rhodocollybia butyracea TaxID=206335 RepID=A0A9P5PUP0_9AGAR|nr:hypothetical protein BDP27DRAFT_1363084 [Rhodocollybia butyracea]
MSTHQPHSPSYSLKDLVLVGSFVKFVIGMTAAILMQQRNGTVNGTVNDAVNDALCALAVVVVVQGFLGSVVNWVDSRRKEERLHETLQERDALWAASSSGSTSSAQLSITGPVDVVAAGNGQDGQADIDRSVTAPSPSATTSMITPSPTLIPSTSLPASGEPLHLSQVENPGQNQRSIQIIKRNVVQLEMQQLTPTSTQTSIMIIIATSSTSSTDGRSSIFPPAPGVSIFSERKGMNEEPITINLVTTDGGVEQDTQGNQSNSTEKIESLSPGIGPNTAAAGCDSQYSEETDIGQRGMIAHNDPLTMGAMSRTDARSSTFPPAPGTSMLAEGKGMNEELVTINLVTTDGGAERDTQSNRSNPTEEIESLSLSVGPNTTAAGCDGQYSEESGIGQRGMITHDNLLTTSAMPSIQTNITATSSTDARSSTFPPKGKGMNEELVTMSLAAADNGVEQDTQGNQSNSAEKIESLSPDVGPSTARKQILAEDSAVGQGLHPTTEGDRAGIQERMEATSGGDYVEVGQYREQIMVIHDSPMTSDTSPSTASWMLHLLAGEDTDAGKQEQVEVPPDTRPTEGDYE